jgi:hypothetical protein
MCTCHGSWLACWNTEIMKLQNDFSKPWRPSTPVRSHLLHMHIPYMGRISSKNSSLKNLQKFRHCLNKKYSRNFCTICWKLRRRFEDQTRIMTNLESKLLSYWCKNHCWFCIATPFVVTIYTKIYLDSHCWWSAAVHAWREKWGPSLCSILTVYKKTS